jgi:bifunctional enzyme CysN/CysC
VRNIPYVIAIGLYRRALAGDIKNFTGIDQPYEAPESCEIHLTAAERPPDVLADEIIGKLLNRIC